MTDRELMVFDVNETLLDVSALKSAFEQAVGPTVSISEWFARLVHASLVANHLGRYRPFGEIGAEVLNWLAMREGIELSEGVASDVVKRMRTLPPHADVPGGLARLAEAGFRLIAFTNGSLDTATAQIESAGLSKLFEGVLSVEAVGRFKPAPEVYLHVAATCGVEIDQMMMVAAHDWDVAGAMSVGASGAFIIRQPWGIPGPLPTLVAVDINDLADQLIVGDPGS